MLIRIVQIDVSYLLQSLTVFLECFCATDTFTDRISLQLQNGLQKPNHSKIRQRYKPKKKYIKKGCACAAVIMITPKL